MVPVTIQILAHLPQKVTPEAGVSIQTLLAVSRSDYTCGRKLWLECEDNTVLRSLFGGKKNPQTNNKTQSQTKKYQQQQKKILHHQKAQNFPFTFAAAALFSQGLPRVSMRVAPFPVPPGHRATAPIMEGFVYQQELNSLSYQTPAITHRVRLSGIWMILRPFYSDPCFQVLTLLPKKNQTVEKQDDLWWCSDCHHCRALLKCKGLKFLFHPGHVTDVRCFMSLKGNFEGEGRVK